MPGFDKTEAVGIAIEEFTEEIAKADRLPTRRYGQSTSSEPRTPARGRRLDYTSFFAAVYEIVDSWTAETDARSYTHFLELLYSRITNEDTGAFLELPEINFCQALEDFQVQYRPVAMTWDKG